MLELELTDVKNLILLKLLVSEVQPLNQSIAAEG